MPKDKVQNNQEPTQEELLEAQKALKSRGVPTAEEIRFKSAYLQTQHYSQPPKDGDEIELEGKKTIFSEKKFQEIQDEWEIIKSDDELYDELYDEENKRLEDARDASREKTKKEYQKKVKDIVRDKDSAFARADLAFADENLSFEEKKARMAEAVSEVIAGSMYEKALSGLHGLSGYEHWDKTKIPKEEEIKNLIKESAKEIRGARISSI